MWIPWSVQYALRRVSFWCMDVRPTQIEFNQKIHFQKYLYFIHYSIYYLCLILLAKWVKKILSIIWFSKMSCAELLEPLMKLLELYIFYIFVLRMFKIGWVLLIFWNINYLYFYFVKLRFILTLLNHNLCSKSFHE